MLWIPPPHWFVIGAVALVAHIAVVVAVFARRGWKRGVLAVPVTLVLFAIGAIAGSLLDAALWQLDPFPLAAVLAVAVYGAFALMMRPRPPSA